MCTNFLFVPRKSFADACKPLKSLMPLGNYREVHMYRE
jgi:hypothetical protein